MKKLILTVALLGASNASADGFVCRDFANTLSLKVYNKTRAEEGTRNAAVMVLSDPRVSYGRKTIATFDSESGLLGSEDLVYSAKVDLRYRESSRAGEYILGTRLGQVDRLHLHVYGFSYSLPVSHGTELMSNLIVDKRNGGQIVEPLLCTRYLKNK